MKSQKVTANSGSDTHRHGRWYGDACGTAFGLEILGERWAMLIVRELLLGPRRFSDLRASLPQISAKVLTERLEGLEGWGVVERRHMDVPAPVKVYALTEWGMLAETAIMELGRWAARSALHDPRLPLSGASLMTSMKTMQTAALAKSRDICIAMRVGAEAYRVMVVGAKLRIERGRGGECDATLTAHAAPPIAAALYSDIPLEALESEVNLEVQGDREVLTRFLALFELPPKVNCPRA